MTDATNAAGEDMGHRRTLKIAKMFDWLKGHRY